MRKPITLLAVAVFYVGLVCALSSLGQQSPPEPKLVLPVRIDNVVDGDTIDVVVMIRTRVRLLECWAPEANTPEGQRSTTHLVQLAEDQPGWITVPLDAEHGLRDLLSFGRVLAHVAVEAGDLAELQIEAGHATKEKP